MLSEGLSGGLSNGLSPDDLSGVVIALLLPLTAGMLVAQVNPYHALIVRGILGAVAALVYAVFGAADVALTEALVGTMLSITLYAIAVRSSMSMRLGVLASAGLPKETAMALQRALHVHHLRLEVVEYDGAIALKKALIEKSIHSIYLPSHALQTRVQRLYEILQSADAEIPPLTHTAVDPDGDAAPAPPQPFDLTESPS